ncbi:cobyrinate a,c-diamide synthase [Maridesulfovibrio bastinii]|uniref:cobyrinate a,c-diamide synthase n=1 Tax=Maridesulfovibrio bastinii TaxID=47157 RepID=UPI0004196369|nr:cobyrinate a,c-diamide synthase [Maridesulfovibrio bastinii]
MNFPRIVLAGLSGGTGKTIVTLGICRALRNKGLAVKPFKKGPDYIDARWLGLAAGESASNLDPHLMPAEKLPLLMYEKGKNFDISVIEGNRGLFDGKDVEGSCSTAELARIIAAPVILAIDCTKMTRTVAAIVSGCRNFESGFNLAGVILNRTAGERHRSILRRSIEEYTDVPVLGMLPKLSKNPIPERHMGLVSNTEYARQDSSLETLGRMAEECIDLDRLTEIAGSAGSLEVPELQLWPENCVCGNERPVIGVVRDEAFWFYYDENLEALEHAGAEVRELSLLSDEDWPELHGLYLGGGFPETMADKLSANVAARKRVKSLADSGLPVFAECGGFMYLGESVEYKGQSYPMSGVLPISTKLCLKPQGLGYTCGVVEADNLFFKTGTEICGHEFHYSLCVNEQETDFSYALSLKRGKGTFLGRDGIVKDNVYAGYNHIHALGNPQWAENFVTAAEKFKNRS